MSNNLTLESRMKEYYENSYRIKLAKNLPVILRIDGCHFHTYTKLFKKPVDDLMKRAMQETCKYLCENIQNCKLGFVESDEISLLLYPSSYKSEYWFDNNLQKMVSVSASMASAFFNGFIKQFIDEYDSTSISYTIPDLLEAYEIDPKKVQEDIDYCYRNNGYATFDSRAFILPEYEVANYFIWRQNDCTRNSISSLAQSLFSHKELQGLNSNELQNKMLTEKNANWNNLSAVDKRGSVCYKIQYTDIFDEKESVRTQWQICEETPIFKEDKKFIEQFLVRNE